MKLSDIPNPTAVFFEPSRNVPWLAKDYGITVFCGPECEGKSSLNPAQIAAKEAEWLKAVADAGAVCVIKNPQPGKIPANCVGFMHQVDEPNGKGILPAAMRAQFEYFRSIDPSMPVFMSMAGDKITSANFGKPVELQLYLDYAKYCDIFTVDVYAMNRNASRYKTTWTADAVKKLADATGKPVWAWIEVNDQQLNPPTPPDINREPMPQEIQDTVTAALNAGAKGIGWFATCDSGKYGWGTGVADFANRGDSYWPKVNRKGQSIQPQLDVVKAIGLTRKGTGTPPPPPPPVDPTIELKKQIADLTAAKNDLVTQLNYASGALLHQAEIISKARDAAQLLVSALSVGTPANRRITIYNWTQNKLDFGKQTAGQNGAWVFRQNTVTGKTLPDIWESTIDDMLARSKALGNAPITVDEADLTLDEWAVGIQNIRHEASIKGYPDPFLIVYAMPGAPFSNVISAGPGRDFI